MKKNKRKPLKKLEFIKHYQYYLMILPAFLFYFLFKYLPLPGIVIAFKDFNVVDGIWGSAWNGLKNFEFFFKSDTAVTTTLNVLWINFIKITLGTVINVTFAIIISEIRNVKRKRIYQNVMFLPHFLSSIVVARLIDLLFAEGNGLLNKIIESLEGNPVVWTDHPWLWVWIYFFACVWHNIGYNVVVYISAIVGIDSELFEAASLDGATRFQQIRYITLPLLTPTIIILTLMSIGKIFYGDFETIYAIIANRPTIWSSMDIIETYVFRAMKNQAAFSEAGAIGLYQSIVGFVLICGSNWLVKKYDPDYSLY